ncbi:MAG TPA: tetratricopeptide repeat protein [Opitutaceae bacterium]|jgi:tetratricopeptide (TPR) repeat protein|nr:tetratricopeptide repeat protein [Opitutaceae bacterium]
MRLRGGILLAGLGIVLVTILAYANTLSAPFIFDDVPAIANNPTIRRLGDLGRVLSPSATDGSSVSGRPVVNLSLALNYAAGGMAVRGYHLANLAIHLGAALLLFGIVRRTAERAGRTDATLLGAAVAALWAAHPLLTEAVTCIIQRTESLMGLFYLLTLYAFVRGAAGPRKGWLLLSWAACLLGMGTKEVMVSAPLIVFLFDRTFVAGTFRRAWTERRGYYGALAATWLLLAWLMVGNRASRGGSVGFGHGVSPWGYALTQAGALVHYLRLCFWPHPLVIDYGTALAPGLGAVWPQGLLVLALLALTAWTLVRRPVAGFLGAWFFAILAPSSSFVPLVTQTLAEHRMYLPLAAVVALAVLAIAAQARTLLAAPLRIAGTVLLAGGLALATRARNSDYRTENAIWSQAVGTLPGNARAHYNLGTTFEHAGAAAEAEAQYREAIRLKSDYAEPHNNLGDLLFQQGRLAEAEAQFRAGLSLQPANAQIAYNLGNALIREGRAEEAIGYLNGALKLKPAYAEAEGNLGVAYAMLGRFDEARAHCEAALRIDPDYAVAHYDLGNVQAHQGRMAAAVAEYEAALRLDPNYAKAHLNLGNALFQLGRPEEAARHYQEALRREPGNVLAHFNLGNLYLQLNRIAEARAEYEAALRLNPQLQPAKEMLDRLNAAGP